MDWPQLHSLYLQGAVVHHTPFLFLSCFGDLHKLLEVSTAQVSASFPEAQKSFRTSRGMRRHHTFMSARDLSGCFCVWLLDRPFM